VATLPAEQQVSAAMAGKDELKQAAKRVRESKKKQRDESQEEPGAEAADPVKALEQRVAELTAENDTLRKQVAELRAQLGQ
jgi:predicted S18 family serine protease